MICDLSCYNPRLLFLVYKHAGEVCPHCGGIILVKEEEE